MTTLEKIGLVVGSVIIALIIGCGIFAFKNATSMSSGDKGFGAYATGSNVTNLGGILSLNSVTNPGSGAIVTLGTLEVPQLSYYTSTADVNFQAVRVALNTTSTTDCTLSSPFTATSTLVSLIIRLDSSSTTVQTLVFATSTLATPSASSSPFYTVVPTVPAGGQFQASWDAGVNNSLVPPGGSVVITSNGGTGTFSNTGICTGMFQSI